MKIFIDQKQYEVKADQSILEACNEAGVQIPSLCFAKNIGAVSTCGLCVVEVSGNKELIKACSNNIYEGIEIQTASPRVIETRSQVMQKIIQEHNMVCGSCAKVDDCRLLKTLRMVPVQKPAIDANKKYPEVEDKTHILFDPSKCIKCNRCEVICRESQQVDAFNGGKCIHCGQCVSNCPTGALSEKCDFEKLKNKLSDPNIHCIVATAPSVRVSMGEGFKLPVGTNAQGKMVAALRKVGFDRVFDLDFAADMTIIEEGHEFLQRVKNEKNLPHFTSCCPGWVNYIEHYHPELIPNLSTTKSPMGIFGALAKTYYAQKINVDPKNIYLVMLMPCIAKADEIARDQIRDIDMILTTRMATRLFKNEKINLALLEDEEYDDPLSMASGAGLIFGVSGGVCEATLRDVADKLPREIKTIKISGITNVENLLQDMKSGKVYYDFIEVMTCPGGCVNGGGQLCDMSDIQDNVANAKKRADTIKKMDENCSIRKCSDNPATKKIYEDFLGSPGSELAEKLLHTKFTKK